jgi:hypothetical protein
VEEGTKNRTVGATLMNASSSRYFSFISEHILSSPSILDKKKLLMAKKLKKYQSLT